MTILVTSNKNSNLFLLDSVKRDLILPSITHNKKISQFVKQLKGLGINNISFGYIRKNGISLSLHSSPNCFAKYYDDDLHLNDFRFKPENLSTGNRISYYPCNNKQLNHFKIKPHAQFVIADIYKEISYFYSFNLDYDDYQITSQRIPDFYKIIDHFYYEFNHEMHDLHEFDVSIPFYKNIANIVFAACTEKVDLLNDLKYSASIVSPREINCMGQFLNGLSYDEIAKKLFISKYTVANHIRNFKEKTNCKSIIDTVTRYKELIARIPIKK